MRKQQIKRNLILGVLFFLPVMFVLVLSLSEDNYNPLDIINKNVVELPPNAENIILQDHITVLAFFGNKPMDMAVAASNLKELVYDKFKGFKKFQIVVLVPNSAEVEAEALFKEIARYEDLRFWHFVPSDEAAIQKTFNSLKASFSLSDNLASDNVFLIDTERHQRGRLDDRTDQQKGNNAAIYGLDAYNCIQVAVIKNKMSAEDLRVLFTEYRQKRKGNFDSETRRANELKPTSHEQKN
ncbi:MULTISPECIES: hypothetical protein [Bizionia]|uniref:Uncharacterized protein n=1 Tax=Bizionia algoritergicola TaxID=291187 RepID=A0A5D0R1W5_9FLAO|nr:MULTISPECIES: hypothetical protein [Bizionia]OBX23823.1 hypothetical protein BAA08_02365 [Bizionia sp. APA-3]TYB75513.1 hypothetical protein ES675_05160 [Bizionia algoritergicola]